MASDLTSRGSKPHGTSRRHIISGAIIGLAGIAAASEILAMPQQQSTKAAPTAPANETRTSLHQEVELKASPQHIFDVLLDSKQFAAFAGMPAEIDPKAGGAFTMFGGMIVGPTSSSLRASGSCRRRGRRTGIPAIIPS